MSYRTIVDGSGRWMVLGMLLALAVPLDAQQRGDRRGPRGGVSGVERSVAQALARAESLELDEARVAELRRMRDELREIRSTERTRRQALRDQMQIESRALREEIQPRRQAVEDRFQELLSEDERRELRRSTARDGRGRMEGRRRSMRPRADFRRGQRGGRGEARPEARRRRLRPGGGVVR